MKRLFAVLLVVALLATGCAQPTETPQPPTPTPTPSPRPTGETTPSEIEDAAVLAGHEEVVTVLIGEAIDCKTVSFDPPDGQWGDYAFWQVQVERYLVNPQAEQILTVRGLLAVRYSGIPSDQCGIPVKEPRLRLGERAVLFLKAAKGPEGENILALTGGPLSGGMAPVNPGDMVSWIGRDGWVVEPLEVFVQRVTQYAREAGKLAPQNLGD